MECKYSGEMKEIVIQLRIDVEDNLKEKNYVEEIDRSVNVEECEYRKNIENIYIYFDEKWFQYRGEGFNFELVEEREGIYLYYRQQNYYDVVLSVLVSFFLKKCLIKIRCIKRQYNFWKNY